jgi:2-oxoglutarate dehydrogenase E2 component (dihydrolipoamide succinyltransferase)
MSIDIKVPTLGESIVEATIGTWHKRPGDAVQAGDVLVELETDKVTVEVAADQAGVLERILKATGANVAVGEVIGALTQELRTENREPGIAGNNAAQEKAVAPVATRETPVTPVARKLADEQGIDVRAVLGSGPGGRITKDDVRAHTPPPAAPPPAPAAPPAAPKIAGESGRPEERIRMSRRRQTIARRLVEAKQITAMLTTFNEIDMSAVMELRKRRRDSFKERHGVGLGFMSFFTRAVIGALKAFPYLNAEIQGDEILLKRYYDIGVAVGTDEGLVVPVLRDADKLNFAEIERRIAELAKRARDGKLALADLQGGTFTISNGGVYGSLMSTPILNYPQVGILGMHKIQERPVVVQGAIAIRPMMYVALSYDHRIIDGAEAVGFLVRVKELVEDPEALLLEG